MEVHMSSPTLDTWDSWQLVCAGLAPAAASSALVGRGEQLLREEGGLQAKGNQLAILRQDVLAGGVASCKDTQLSELGLERRLAALMGSSVLTARDSVLCSLVLQARPLMQMVGQEKRIASLAVEQFMHYISPRDKEMREMLVQWLVGDGWEQLVRQLCEKKL